MILSRKICVQSIQRSQLQHSHFLSSFSRKNTASRSTGSSDLDFTSEVANTLPDSFKSTFLQSLLERGFIHQCTDYKELDNVMQFDGPSSSQQKPIAAYLGFDATAKSLHVGSLLQIMILRNLQRCGHKPIILIGGGTTKVGDPSGKDESRQLLTEEAIQENIDSLTKVFEKFIKFGNGPSDAILVNNADWLDSIKYLDFLRNYGRFFTINRMLTFESVKQRLSREQPLTFLEFNYLLLQAYDFLELNRRHNVKLQLGGSDQWGGVELTRKIDQSQVFGLTAPLLTTSDGKKMGKTASGAVWLNKDLLSEFDYWQFWRNTADADVIRFLKIFTELPMDQIREYEILEGSALNDLKVILADSATSMLHGSDCLEQIHSTVQSLFSKGGGGGDLDSLAKVSLSGDDVPEDKGISIVDLLVKAELTTSKGEAKRLIKLGGAKVNDVKIDDESRVVKRQDFDDQGRLKLSSGKKKHILVVLDRK